MATLPVSAGDLLKSMLRQYHGEHGADAGGMKKR
jgi:hypothetical protein